MKKNSILSGIILTAALGFASCMENDFNLAEGEGTLHVRTTVSDAVTVVSRVSQTQQDLEEGLKLWVCKSDGSVVREYLGLANVPSDIKLIAGNYFVEGWTGDSVPASFTDKYFYGRSESFAITNNDLTNVSLKCKIQNVVVSVNYEASVKEILKDYSFTVEHKTGSLTFEGDTKDKGYFMMSSADKDLSWKLEGTTFDDKPYSRSGVLKDVKKTTEYAITIAYNYGSGTTLGGGYLDINIDDTPIDQIENEFDLALAPTIMGLGTTDLSKTISGEPGEVGLQAFLIAGASPLTEAIMRSSALCEQLGYTGETELDLLNMSESVRATLEQKGLSCSVVKWDNAIEMTGPMTIQVAMAENFFTSWPYGDYPIQIIAQDTKNKSSEATLHILLTQAKVDTEDPDLFTWGEIYAMLNGRKIKEASSYGFLYSINNGTETYAEATLSGNKFNVKVDGINPGDKVTYQAVCDYNTPEAFISTTSKSIQLPQVAQMPNNSFEQWITSTPMIPTDNTNNQFWDTGNHGSATMDKNVTTYSTVYSHSGNYSACLQSQFVGVGTIGKFAAGNIFVGEYLDTQGTDGVLGFGKRLDLNYKPKAISFWVRYEPKAIDNVAKKLPDGINITKGDMDQGIVYFALLSDSKDETYNGKTYPVIVMTKTKQFFDKEGGNVIAYGERIFDTEIGGEGMVKVEVPFSYNIENLKPTYIMCTFAASRYGDYFSGGPSTMYVDDVEIVY